MVQPGVDICNNLSADLETFLRRGDGYKSRRGKNCLSQMG